MIEDGLPAQGGCFWLSEHPMAELSRLELAQRHVIDAIHVLQLADFAANQVLYEFAKSRVEISILVKPSGVPDPCASSTRRFASAAVEASGFSTKVGTDASSNCNVTAAWASGGTAT